MLCASVALPKGFCMLDVPNLAISKSSAQVNTVEYAIEGINYHVPCDTVLQ